MDRIKDSVLNYLLLTIYFISYSCFILKLSAKIPLLDYHLSSVGICGKINFPEITDSNSASD